MAATRASPSGWQTVTLCFMVALLEGFDLQSVGIAAAGIQAAFHLTPIELGWVFSAGLIGLLPGAFCGGLLADRYGRKRVLLAAVLLFGLASLATAMAFDLASLLLARLLTGVGIGAALPMVIALASESAQAHQRSMAVSVTFCGIPLGGACAALAGMAGNSVDWHMVFYIGGYAPLGVAVLLAFMLPESRMFAQQARQVQAGPGRSGRDALAGLFAQGLMRPTLQLWLSSFFTLTVLYMLMNWLPSLLLSHGLSRVQVGQVQVLFNVGGAAGALVTGRLMDRLHGRRAVVLGYGAILLGLAGLGLAGSVASILAAAAVVGYGLMGGQGILYALAPILYPTRIRATGVGVSIAVGRLGSVSGPLLAAKLLGAGAGIGGIAVAVAPGILLAAASAFSLLRSSASQPRAPDSASTKESHSHETSRIS